MQARIFIATTNAGKLADFQPAAELFGVRLETLPNTADLTVPREDADTFAGNARIKAIAYSLSFPDTIVVADDSGLEVDVLDGAPGVYSARYASRAGFQRPDGSSIDEWNNACLLHAVQGFTDETLTARYRCVLVAARNGEVIATGKGSVEGIVLKAPRGHGGFGYDPLLLVPELGMTMAEIDAATKLRLSHRGHALRDLMTRLTPS
jgi:XTP/dITP diphosphohydrolase